MDHNHRLLTYLAPLLHLIWTKFSWRDEDVVISGSSRGNLILTLMISLTERASSVATVVTSLATSHAPRWLHLQCPYMSISRSILCVSAYVISTTCVYERATLVGCALSLNWPLDIQASFAASFARAASAIIAHLSSSVQLRLWTVTCARYIFPSSLYIRYLLAQISICVLDSLAWFSPP